MKKIENNNANHYGNSIKNAIVVGDIEEEYLFLELGYPGYQLLKQELKEIDDKFYDVMHIYNNNEEKCIIYFDITEHHNSVLSMYQ